MRLCPAWRAREEPYHPSDVGAMNGWFSCIFPRCARVLLASLRSGRGGMDHGRKSRASNGWGGFVVSVGSASTAGIVTPIPPLQSSDAVRPRLGIREKPGRLGHA
jgi:hypothetical protein